VPRSTTGKIVYAPFINGYPDNTVKPDGSMTRAELAQIVYNLYNNGERNAASYPDVANNYWALNVIGFCQVQKYLIGYLDGTFRPEGTVSRAELSTLLVRVKNLALTSNNPFPDVGNHWGKEFIGAAYAGSLIIGYPDGTFRPDDPVTRAEAVTLICRAENRDEKLFDIKKRFVDLNAGFWGYNYIMNAANGYNYN